MRRRVYTWGSVLFECGQPGDSMFLLFEGLLHLQAVAVDGAPPAKVGQLVPGQVIGDLSLLTGDVREVTVVAATDAVAYEITKPDMKRSFCGVPSWLRQWRLCWWTANQGRGFLSWGYGPRGPRHFFARLRTLAISGVALLRIPVRRIHNLFPSFYVILNTPNSRDDE